MRVRRLEKQRGDATVTYCLKIGTMPWPSPSSPSVAGVVAAADALGCCSFVCHHRLFHHRRRCHDPFQIWGNGCGLFHRHHGRRLRRHGYDLEGAVKDADSAVVEVGVVLVLLEEAMKRAERTPLLNRCPNRPIASSTWSKQCKVSGVAFYRRCLLYLYCSLLSLAGLNTVCVNEGLKRQLLESSSGTFM